MIKTLRKSRLYDYSRIIMLLLLLLGTFTVVDTKKCLAVDMAMVPLSMKPNTIITYDENKTCTIVEGGYLDNELKTVETAEKICVEPNTKVIYDKNGYLHNIYYLVDGEYRLNKPSKNTGLLKNNTGVLRPGYGKLRYGVSTECILDFRLTQIVGTGMLTYFGQPDDPDHKGAFRGDHNNDLKVGDCATRKWVDDVSSGTIVHAKNMKNGKTMTFKKNDIGFLPSAVLDIFEDGKWSKKGIRGLTVGNVRDSVDNGAMWHSY